MLSIKRKTTPTRICRNALAAVLMLLSLSFTGCKGLGTYDDLEACPRGVIMRFVFDYNLEFANSFPHHVDCLTVYLFDKDGNLVERRTETTEVLADENWRMTWELPAGQYQVVAYGGMECDAASFAHTKAVSEIKNIRDLDALINAEHVGDEASRPQTKLHDQFHGLQSFTVNEGTDYDRTTVYMMRNTNNIRIVLQHLDYSPVNDKDFRFEIVDDNTHMAYNNDVLPRQTVTYTPWVTGTVSTGVHNADNVETADGRADTAPDDVQVAVADLSVSRLIHKSSFVWTSDKGTQQRGPRLRIIYKELNHVVADLPLNNYLLLLKGEHLASMDNQEFLDRANNYSLIFFLDQNNAWIQMNIVVDDWTVRINNITDWE